MEDAQFMRSWPAWLRWLCVIPYACFGFIAIGCVVWLVSLFAPESNGGPGTARFFLYTFASFSFIYGGAMAAPQHKMQTAVVLSAFLLLLAWQITQHPAIFPEPLIPVVTLALGVAAFWIMALREKAKRRKT
jgi:thiol:disulfide interchange protein